MGKNVTDSGVMITKEEYTEYRRLRARYSLELNLESARQAKTLEADIDAPIKSVVAMLALLGCEVAWSCCGFDYEGQPRHKSHEYGMCGVTVIDNEAVWGLSEHYRAGNVPFQWKVNGWKFLRRNHYGDRLVSIMSDTKTFNSWPDPECIHYSEPGAIALGILKRFLFSLRDEFADSAVLKSFNAVYKSRCPDWQYPILEDWVVKKDDVIAMVKEEFGGEVSEWKEEE